MKYPLKTNFDIRIMTILGYTAVAQDTNVLLNKYYAVKNALVDSDVRAANVAVTELQKEIAAQGNFDGRDDLGRGVNKLAVAHSIDKQRAAFNEVSTLMWQIVKKVVKVSERIYYQYCPMEKVYWLSEEPLIRNPYFGNTMLTCGKVSEIKQ